jgi:hypothetical protein
VKPQPQPALSGPEAAFGLSGQHPNSVSEQLHPAFCENGTKTFN